MVRGKAVVVLLIFLLLAAGCGTGEPSPAPAAESPVVQVTTPLPTPSLPPTATTKPGPTALPTPEDQAEDLTGEQIATLNSLELVDGYPLYVMHYQGEYALAEAAGDGGGVAGARALPPWACSLFAAQGNSDSYLYGRNFDWRFSPALLLFTAPPDGYASVSMVDIEYLGFGAGTAGGLVDMTLDERRGLLDAPRLPFDGMNEQGFVVGMAAVPVGNMRPDPDKETIGSLGVIRQMLDHAADVDEAVAIVERYNVDFEGATPLHYLIADRSGRSVLVEFYRGEMEVIPNEHPWQHATNFLRSSVSGSPEGQCWRYDQISDVLAETGGKLDRRGALDLLSEVAQDGTQWSVVYDQSSGQVDVVMGREFAQPHTFRLDLAGESAAATEPKAVDQTLEAPQGTPPTIDGALEPDEWAGARQEALSDGSELLLMQDGEYLYLAIRAQQNGLGSLCVAHDNEVSVLHSSAALGTAVYEQGRDVWQQTRNFDWTCRDTGDSQQAQAEREHHLQQEGWLASNARMGEPTEMEYQIAMSDGQVRLAVVYLTGARYTEIAKWPVDLDDDCQKLELIQGEIPETLQLSPEMWMNVVPAGGGAEGEGAPASAALGSGEIAFYSERDGDAEIFLMDADGGNPHPLTDNDADDHCPAWSPDGMRIAFVSDRHDPSPKRCFPECNYEIFVMDADGSRQQRLTESEASEFHPAWSPDGTQIAFVTDRDGNDEIYVMDVGGGNARRLTDDPAADMRPSWSPDGSRIAFNSQRDGNWEIYVMDADGQNQLRLTDSPAWELFPAWSPDGTGIAYFAMPSGSGTQDVYAMAADGTEVQKLTDHPRVDEDPAWSPDGTQIVFQSDRDGNFEIYVMDADGGNQRALTSHRSGDYWPAWRPIPGGTLDREANSPDAGQKTGVLRMVTVFDNTALEPELQADWGFGAWLEYDGHVVLFDTGANGPMLLSNMEKLGLDPQRIEVVVLSHIHGDHTWGLEALLQTGVQPVVYVPASFPDSFKEEVSAYTELVEVSKAFEILPGIHTTGEIVSAVREQCLIVETPQGIVVITGCAHPGIVRMVKVAHNVVEEDIALVVGGFHLGDMRDSAVRRLILDFEALGVQQVSPTHCTGGRAIAIFAEKYGDDYIDGGVGQVYEVGLQPGQGSP